MKLFRGTEPHEKAVENFKNNLALLNTFIGENKFMAGDELTIADISTANTFLILLLNDYKDLEEYPNVKAWRERLEQELPYYAEQNETLSGIYKQMFSSLLNNDSKQNDD